MRAPCEHTHCSGRSWLRGRDVVGIIVCDACGIVVRMLGVVAARTGLPQPHIAAREEHEELSA